MIFVGFYRKISRQLAIGTCLLFVSLQVGFSQAPESFVQALSRHGVAVTKPALVEALRNPDKEVRGLAAAELAELKATDTLPEIMRAAQIEQDTLTKVNIAAAATWLGSPDGLNMLKRVCRDSTLPPYARQNAARKVFDKGDHTCFNAVADMMLPSEDPDTRIGALYLLSQLHDRTEDESRLVLQSLVAALTDSDLRIRLETCPGLRWLNNPEAITPLRNALATEREEIVRSRMQSTLESLVNQCRK
jgi:HEAT repeat protein